MDRLVLCLVFIMFYVLNPFGSLADTPPPSELMPDNSSEGPQITVEGSEGVVPPSEEVKLLRMEKRRKMPYLDSGYLKESVNARSLQKKHDFSQSEQKQLEEVINRAIEVYTPAKAAKERISLARRRILAAVREMLPGASFNFELRKGSLSRDSFSGQDYHWTFRLPLFRGGILWNTLRREKAEFRAAKREYDGVLNELVDEVAKAYFEFNRAREVFEYKKELSGRVREKHLLSQRKYKEALISEIEYLNVESLAGQVEYDVETGKQELELAKLELQRYLGLDVGDEIDVAPLYSVDALIKTSEEKDSQNVATEYTATLAQSLEEFMDLAYQNRPELQVEAERMRAARLQEAINRGAFLPRADLLLEFGELGEAFIRDADDPTHFPEWHLGFELSNNVFGNKMKYTFDNDENAPSVTQFLQSSGSQTTRRKLEIGIFDGLEEYAELKEATVKKLEQVVELEKKEREVIREVKEAYFDFRKAQVQAESSIKRNQYRQRLVKLADLRLQKAEIEISEFVQSEIDLAEERGRLHQALTDLFKARSKLNKAIGIRNFLPMEDRYAL